MPFRAIDRLTPPPRAAPVERRIDRLPVLEAERGGGARTRRARRKRIPVMTDDPWLARWLPLLATRVGEQPILELGCGVGRDSEVLAAAGHRVVGIDLSAAAVAQATARVPAGEFHCQDLRAPFPAAAARVNVVLASLSLHYFVWPETMALVRRIGEALRRDGLLLCRLNSTEDHHFGASGHPQIEADYYLVDGQPKRFFDRSSISRLFDGGWRVLHVEHCIVRRYAKPKALWEVVVEKAW